MANNGAFEFELNGRSFVNELLKAQARNTNDTRFEKYIKIFEKYNLSILDGLALLIEISTATEDTKNAEM